MGAGAQGPSVGPLQHCLWVVDDVELEREAARRALEPVYALELFGDGAAVLERVAAQGELPDVLVLDWHMSGVGGLEVLRFLRANERTVGLPILVFTATGDSHDLLEALASGADDYVVKGASTAELRARVGSLIRSKTLRERAERAERELAALLARERDARAEAEAANRAKDQFLAMVSHELRTPLTAILGWTRILKSGPNEEDRLRRAIDTIERNALAQARLIDDLLDVARIVSGKLRLECCPVDLSDAVEQAIETVRPSASAKGITLTSELRRGCSVAGDPARLQQIAWNLLANAIKFTPADGRVHVTLEQHGEEMVLRVTDSGRGIAPELLPHVFDRFRQGDPTATRRHGGLGLGLAIVRELVHLHGGEVRAHSDGPGRGATFEVSLAALARPADDRGSRDRARSGVELTGLSVLVVEDDHDTRELLSDVLSSRGARVSESGSAKDALTLLRGQRPDAILSDIAMPGHDGYWLIRAVRRSADEGTSGIPAVAITAHTREEDRFEAFAAGFQECLPKPIDPDALVETIARLCADGAGKPVLTG